jgi:hypothetical protein
MAINLIEALQTKLGFPPLQKIDPNTQEEKATPEATNALAQAAIPVVLEGLYKFTRSHDNADDIERGNISTNWATNFFGDDSQNVIAKVAAYGGVAVDEAESVMDRVVKETVNIVQERTGDQPNGNAFRDYVTAQRADILLYLPPALHLGENLNDTTMDDRTNKMEGPVSSFMHTIEKAFSGSDSNKN